MAGQRDRQRSRLAKDHRNIKTPQECQINRNRMGIEVSGVQQSEAEVELTKAWNVLAGSGESHLMKCETISDAITNLTFSMKAIKTDAKNLRELNANLTERIVEIINLLHGAGIHYASEPEEHLCAGARAAVSSVVDAVAELLQLRSDVQTLRDLKINSVTIIDETWRIIRSSQFGYLSDGKRPLPQVVERLIGQLVDAQDSAAESQPGFVDGVLTINTGDTTIVVVQKR